MERQIPEIFRQHQREAPAMMQASGTSRHDNKSTQRQPEPSPPQSTAIHPPRALCLDDLKAVADDIKSSFNAAILELRRDMQNVTNRLEEVEELTDRHDSDIYDAQKHLILTLHS